MLIKNRSLLITHAFAVAFVAAGCGGSNPVGSSGSNDTSAASGSGTASGVTYPAGIDPTQAETFSKLLHALPKAQTCTPEGRSASTLNDVLSVDAIAGPSEADVPHANTPKGYDAARDFAVWFELGAGSVVGPSLADGPNDGGGQVYIDIWYGPQADAKLVVTSDSDGNTTYTYTSAVDAELLTQVTQPTLAPTKLVLQVDSAGSEISLEYIESFEYQGSDKPPPLTPDNALDGLFCTQLADK